MFSRLRARGGDLCVRRRGQRRRYRAPQFLHATGLHRRLAAAGRRDCRCGRQFIRHDAKRRREPAGHGLQARARRHLQPALFLLRPGQLHRRRRAVLPADHGRLRQSIRHDHVWRREPGRHGLQAGNGRDRNRAPQLLLRAPLPGWPVAAGWPDHGRRRQSLRHDRRRRHKE